MTDGRFPIGVVPREGESLPGFVIRLGERVGAPDAGRIAALAGLRQPGSATASRDLGRLSRLAGVDRTVLERMAYRPAGTVPARHHFKNGSVHREIIDISRRRFCPLCMSGDAWHRQDWDATLLTACPAHAVRLVAKCPTCGGNPGWNCSKLLACRCGRDLRSWPVSPVPATEVTAARRLLSLAGSADLEWVPRALSECDTADLVHLAMCLGMFLTRRPGERRVETLAAAGPDAVARVMVAGLAALADWPLSLRDHLAAEQLRAGGRPGRYGARKAIGPVYGWLQQMEAGPVRDAVLAVARELPGADPVLARRVHRSSLIPSPDPEGGRIIGLLEAAKMLGRSQSSVKRMMSAGELPAVLSHGRGVPIEFDRGIVAGVAAARAGAVDLIQAASMLGVSKARVRRLLEGGMLEGRKLSDRSWAISAKAVTDLPVSLMEGVPADPKAAGLFPFNGAAEALRRRGYDICRFLELIREGRLAVAAVDQAATGLHALRFSRQHVREVCRSLVNGQSMTIQSAAEKLGFKWEVVAHLARMGFFRMSGPELTVPSVEHFAAEIVTGASLARLSGTSPRKLAERLAETGILPVSGPAVDGGRQTFFRRSDVDGRCE